MYTFDLTEPIFSFTSNPETAHLKHYFITSRCLPVGSRLRQPAPSFGDPRPPSCTRSRAGHVEAHALVAPETPAKTSTKALILYLEAV